MVSLLPAYATSNVIANLKSSEVSSVMIMIAGLGASYILYLFLDLIIFFLRQNVEKNARTYLKKVFMRKLFEHQEIQTDTSKITEILYTDVNNVINLLFIVFDLGINVLFAMLLGAMLFFLSWKFASIVLVTTCISLICTIIMRRKVKEKEVAFRTGTDYHFKLIRDIIQNMRQIKTSNSVDSYLSKYENNLDNVKMVSIGKHNEEIKAKLDQDIAKIEEKLKRLTRMRLDDEISKADYLEYKSEIEKDKERVIKQRTVVKSGVKSVDGYESADEKIQNFLLQKMNFTEHIIDRDVISQFISTIIPRTETCYEWYMDFDLIEKSNDKKKMVWEFTIDYNEARAYRSENDGMLRPTQWSDIIVKVYV